jgi:hypothetical protein
VLVVFSAAAIAGLLGEAFAAVIGASTFFRSRVFRLFGIVCHELLSLSVVTQVWSYSTERGDFYLQPLFSGVLNNISSGRILNPVRAALTTDCRGYLPHYNNTEVQIGSEGCGPRLLRPEQIGHKVNDFLLFTLSAFCGTLRQK